MNIGDRAIVHISQAKRAWKCKRKTIINLYQTTLTFTETRPLIWWGKLLNFLRTLHWFVLNLVRKDSLPKYDRLTELTGVNNHGGGGKTRVAFQALPWTLDIFVRNFNKTVANYVRSILSIRTFIRPATEHRIFSFSGQVRVHPNMRPWSVNKVLWRSLNITSGSSQCLLWKNRCKKIYTVWNGSDRSVLTPSLVF